MSPGRRVPVARLWVSILLGYLALGATLQELPSYIAVRFHAGPLVVGVTVGLAVVAAHTGGASAVWSLVIALPLISAALVASAPREMARPVKAPAGGWCGLVPRSARAAGVILGLASYGYGTLTALLVLFLGTRGLGARQSRRWAWPSSRPPSWSPGRPGARWSTCTAAWRLPGGCC